MKSDITARSRRLSSISCLLSCQPFLPTFLSCHLSWLACRTCPISCLLSCQPFSTFLSSRLSTCSISRPCLFCPCLFSRPFLSWLVSRPCQPLLFSCRRLPAWLPAFR